MQPLANKAIADSPARMGRPPLGVKATTVRLSVATLARIKALVGDNQAATFIREAVEAELKRRERK